MNTLIRRLAHPKIQIWLLLLVGAAVQVGLFWLGNHGNGKPMGDLPFVYEPWMKSLQQGAAWFGLAQPWVYPYLALVPMLVAGLVKTSDYTSGWVLMAGFLNLVALFNLRKNFAAAWYFLAFEALLGPVAISRLDGISVAIALIAVPALLAGRLTASSIWLTVATWIKVWPVALIMSLFLAAKQRLKVLVTVAASSAALVLVAFLLGANGNLFSFISMQSDRGIQIESPIATWYMWQSVFQVHNTGAYYDQKYLTFQVTGAGTEIISQLMGLAMLVAIAITFFLGWRAARTVDVTNPQGYGAVLTATVFTATLDLIVFNKVGSPQYIQWLVIPLVLAICFKLPKWKLAIWGGLLLSALTQFVYPVIYDRILMGELDGVLVLTIRNLLEIALLVWANIKLSSLSAKPSR